MGMTTALGASSWALCWAILLLLTIQTFLAMIVTQVFRPYLQEVGDLSSLTDDRQKRLREIFQYFGTFSRSMLSLFELALANWSPICRFLVEEVNEAHMVFVLLFKLGMGIAVLGVINAVFMQETFKVANTDNDIMVRTKTKAAQMHKEKMETLFRVLDTDGNGRLQREEFKSVLMDPTIHTWLASMDLDASDADTIFDLLCGSDNLIDVDELISGVSLLKGAARSIDMRRLLMIESGGELTS